MKQIIAVIESIKNTLRIVIGCSLFLLLVLLSHNVLAAKYYLTEGNERDGYWQNELEVREGMAADILGDRWILSDQDRDNIETLLHDYGRIKIYQLKRDSLAYTENTIIDSEALVPVFKAPGDEFQIIMGELHVFFSLALADEQVVNFFDSQDIETTNISKLTWGENGYEVHVAPGFSALQIANRLKIMPQVENVYPNLWQTGYQLD